MVSQAPQNDDTLSAEPPAELNPEQSPPSREGLLPYRWVAMSVVLIGTFMVVLDTTVVNLGLPAMGRDFNTTAGIEWIVTAYLAAVGIAQMSSGWAADRFGRKMTFVASLAIFTVGSVLCAASPTLFILVGSRVVQGIGGGLLMPVGMAMIYELFDPSERGRALGIFGIAAMAAPAIGPVLGGSLVNSLGWHWLFLINLPIGLIGIVVAWRVLRDTGFREPRPLDRAGLALSGAGLALFLIGLSEGASRGWTAPPVVMLVGLGVALLILFTRHSLQTQHPLVDVRILAQPIFAIGMVCLSLMSVAQYCRLVYIPLELGSARGISEVQIGLTMLPSALGIAITMPIGGRMADKVGARIPSALGIGIMAASFWPMANLTAETPLPMVSLILFIGGLGSGLAMMAPNIVAMNSVESRQVSQAAGLSSVARQLSAAVGLAMLASFYATIRPEGDPGSIPTDVAIDAYNKVFIVGMLILVVTFIVTQFLPGKKVALELQEARRVEATDLEASQAAHTEAALAAGMEG